MYELIITDSSISLALPSGIRDALRIVISTDPEMIDVYINQPKSKETNEIDRTEGHSGLLLPGEGDQDNLSEP